MHSLTYRDMTASRILRRHGVAVVNRRRRASNGSLEMQCLGCGAWVPVKEGRRVQWSGTGVTDRTVAGLPTIEYYCVTCEGMLDRVLYIPRRLV